MNFFEELIFELFGDLSMAKLIASMILASLGIFLSVTIHLVSRDKTSGRTPKDFNFKFWLKDNWIRTLASLALVFVCIRFAPEIFGKELNSWVSLIVGFSLDKVAETFINYRKGFKQRKLNN